MARSDLRRRARRFLAAHQAELIEFRRDLHAHPEVGYHEHRTTRQDRSSGWRRPGCGRVILPKGTGLLVDIGDRPAGPVVALRADIDALP